MAPLESAMLYDAIAAAIDGQDREPELAKYAVTRWEMGSSATGEQFADATLMVGPREVVKVSRMGFTHQRMYEWRAVAAELPTSGYGHFDEPLLAMVDAQAWLETHFVLAVREGRFLVDRETPAEEREAEPAVAEWRVEQDPEDGAWSIAGPPHGPDGWFANRTDAVLAAAAPEMRQRLLEARARFWRARDEDLAERIDRTLASAGPTED